MSNKSDNPIQEALNRLFFTGKDLNEGGYFSALDQLRSAAGKAESPTVSHLMKSMDPYGVLKRINQFKVYEGAKGFAEIGQQLSHRMGIVVNSDKFDPWHTTGPNTKSVGLDRLFEEIGSTLPDLKIFAKGEELYIGTLHGGLAPLAVQGKKGLIESGLVQIGRASRSARSATMPIKGVETERTFAELFYEKLVDVFHKATFMTGQGGRAASSFIQGVAKLNQSTVGFNLKGKVTLAHLLDSGPTIKGMKTSSYTAMYKSVETMIVSDTDFINMTTKELADKLGSGSLRILGAQKDASDALKTMHQVMKSRGKAPIKAADGTTLNPRVALRQAFNTLSEISKKLPEIYQDFGAIGLHSLTKPDFLANVEKGAVMPSKLAGSAFGSERGPTGQIKGEHHRKKVAYLLNNEKIAIKKAGGRIVPAFVTEDEFNISRTTGTGRRTFRVGVVDSLNVGEERFLFGDSGSLLTPRGTRKLVKTLPLGRISVKNASQEMLVGYRQLTGMSALEGELAAVTINSLDVQRALDKRIKGRNLSTKQRGLRKVIAASRRDIGIFKAWADGSLPGATDKTVILAPKRSGDGIVIDLLSSHKNLRAAGSTTMVTGGRRSTSVPVRRDHVLAGDLSALGRLGGQVGMAKELGVDILVPRTEFMKMRGMQRQNMFLTNFFATMRRNPEVASKYLPGMSSVTSSWTHDGQVSAIIKNETEATAQALRVIRDLRKSGKAGAALAKQIVRGSKVNIQGTALGGLARGLQVFDVEGFARSDVFQDVSMSKPARATLGKIKTMSFGSSLLGYNTPDMDPLLTGILGKLEGQGIKWNHASKDFVMNNDDAIYKFAEALYTPGNVAPAAEDILTMRKGKMFLGDQELRALPEFGRFQHRQGGVPAEDLKGTILDPSLRKKFAYIDIGESKDFGFLGVGEGEKGGALLKGKKTRYVPLPMDMLRLGTGKITTTIDKKHPGYHYIRALAIAQLGDDPGTMTSFHNALKQGVGTVFDTIRGKEGLLARRGSVTLPAGFGSRLIPQQSTLINSSNFADPTKLFEGAVSRKQLIAAIKIREGRMSKDAFSSLMNIAEKGDHIYSGMFADPTQRAEHAWMMKYKISDAEFVSKSKISEVAMDLQVHPLAQLMWERDNDADRIVNNFLFGNEKAYEDRIARQAKAISPMMNFFRTQYEKIDRGTSKIAKMTMDEIFSTWSGQKMFASLGYSEVRPTLERLLPMLLSEGVEGLAARGMKHGGLSGINASHVAKIRELIPNNEELAGALSLSQYLFQGGVGKAKSKMGLQELTEGLLGLTEKGKYGLDITDSVTKAHDLFYKFLADSDKNRIFGVADLLDRKSTPFVLEGLQKGAAIGIEEMRLHKAAFLLASTVGLGYALSPYTDNSYTLAGLAEDTSIYKDAKSYLKRIFAPILGINPVEKETSSGAADMADTQGKQLIEAVIPGKANLKSRLSGLKEEIFKDMKTMSKSKYFKPIAYSLAGLAGLGIINRMTAPSFDSPLPPPSDTSRPMDVGPTVPEMSAAPRINSSRYTPSASRHRHNQNFGSVNANFFQPRTSNNIRIDDRTSSKSNSWLVRRQMNKESESDFAY